MKIGIDANRDGVISDDEVVDLNEVSGRLRLIYLILSGTGVIASSCLILL